MTKLGKSHTICVLLVMFLTGCASIGLEPASAFGERLAYGYSTHAAVTESAATALEIGDIQVDDAQRVLKVSDQARQALDGSEARLQRG